MKAQLITLTAVVASSGSVLAGTGYTVTDLGTIGIEAEAHALNNAGLAVGMSYDTIREHMSVRFDGPGPVPLPGLSGFTQSQAEAVNDSGLIASLLFSLGSLSPHTVLVDSGGGLTDLGEFVPRSMDEQGRVVGVRPVLESTGYFVERAAMWNGSTIVDLPPFQGSTWSIAQDIDSAGRVVGSAIPAGALRPRAVMWDGGSVIDLGTLGGASAQALAMNDLGDVVGVSDTASGSPHAFLFHVENGVVTSRTDLGFLGGDSSAAYGVNNAGQVVGASHARAFLWENGVMHDLNDLVADLDGWDMQAAWAINDSGVIVGQGNHNPAGRRAFMVMPGAPCPADLTLDGVLDLSDIAAFVSAFISGDSAADINGDGVLDVADVQSFSTQFVAGCP